MLVHFITDEPAKIPAIRAVLGSRFQIVPHLLGKDDTETTSGGALLVDADLRQTLRVEQIKDILRESNCITEKLFVVRNNVSSMVAQAYALGATDVLSRPKEIVAKLQQIELANKSAQTGSTDTAPEDLNSAIAFASIFAAIRAGQRISLYDAEYATSKIFNGISQAGLIAWIDDVRRHHEGTFQHCLLVTGVAIGFAMDIGFGDLDIERLGIAATLHDIGKAHIPRSILDKPGDLDLDEQEIIRRHPVLGYELLKDSPGISPEILDAVKHHHEYLDGSGYPDSLMAPAISDLVRLLTISDIFAALIESRSYRPVMPGQKAYKILCDMDGKLDRSLVKAFRNVAHMT